MALSYRDCLVNLINKNNLKNIAEVGVFKGWTTKQICQNCPGVLRYYAIDPWKVYSGSGSGQLAKLDQKEWDRIHNAVRKDFEKDSRVHILRMISEDGAENFPENFFDLVFLDGDHTFDECTKDIKLWWPKVKAGGFLTGDDYTLYKEVGRAVDTFFPLSVVILADGRLWVVQKQNRYNHG